MSQCLYGFLVIFLSLFLTSFTIFTGLFLFYFILLPVVKCLFSKERERGWIWMGGGGKDLLWDWEGEPEIRIHCIRKKSIFNKTKIRKNRKDFLSKMRFFIKHLKSTLSAMFLILPHVPLSPHAGMEGCLWEGGPMLSCILARMPLCASSIHVCISWAYCQIAADSLFNIKVCKQLSLSTRVVFLSQLLTHLPYFHWKKQQQPLKGLCGEAPVASGSHPS